MATRALVFDLVGRDRSLGRTFDQMGRKSQQLGRNFAQAGDEAKRSMDRLRLGVDKANVQLKQAEQSASRARESHARAARIFGRDSDQAYNAALRVAKAQHGVRDASLNVADAQDKLSASANRNVQAAGHSSERWTHVSASLGKVAKTAALAGAALGGAAVIGAARFAAAGIKAAASFDLTMRQFAQVADLPKAQLEDMRKLALKMGADTKFSASQAGQAMLDLAKGGLTAAQIKGGALQATLTLAAAGGIELAQAGQTMANAMNMFGLAAKDSASIAAALAGGANASTASVEDLTLALSQVGPGARNAGLNLQDTVGTLAAFHQAGIHGSDAGTSLKTMLANLVPHTKKARVEMQKLGLDFTDAQGNILPITSIANRLQWQLKGLSDEERNTALATIFGSDATRAATILMNEGGMGLAKYIAATHDRAAAERLAKTNTEGAAGAFEQLRGSIETISIRIGDVFLPPLAKVASWLADKLPTALDKTGSFFGRLWTNIEPVRLALGRLWETVKTSAGQIGGALASAFKAVAPSAGQAKGGMEGFARFIRRDLIPAVQSFTTWLVEKGIPGFLEFADVFINDFSKPVGKATLALASLVAHSFAGMATGVINVMGLMVHGAATAFGWLPEVGKNFKDASAKFDEFANRSKGAMGTFVGAVDTAKVQGGKALDAAGRAADGARGRYEKFQAAARVPITVKIAANINALVAGLESGKIKMGEFKIRANAEIAKITSKPAREKMQQLLGDLARGKIDVATFRGKWNAEMHKLQNAQRVASVIARLKSPAVLKSDLNKARNLIGLARGGQIRGPGTETSDSIPAWLSTGEHVISAREVKGAGGHGAIEQMRSQWRGYATGGMVVRDGTVSRATWNRLLAAGWRGNPNDRMEALYPPGVVRDGTVPQSIWSKLLAAGWRGRPNDRMEALYRPRPKTSTGSSHRRAMERWHWARARRVDAMPDRQRFAWAHKWGLPPSPPGLGWTEDERLDSSMARYRGRPQAYKSFLAHIYAERHKYFARTGYAQGGRAFRVETSGLAGLGARLQAQTAMVDNFVAGVGRVLANQANSKLNADWNALGAAGVSGVRAPSSANRSTVMRVFASMFGWGSAGQRAATDQLLMHESGYRNTAQNPTSSAYGMFQFLNGTWGGVGGHKTSDPYLQAVYGGRYIRGRYGSPAGAWNFWSRHHWYDQGGWLPPGLSMAYNGTGKPERVLSPQESSGIDYPRLGRAVAAAMREAGPPVITLDRRVVSQEVQYELNRQRR